MQEPEFLHDLATKLGAAYGLTRVLLQQQSKALPPTPESGEKLPASLRQILAQIEEATRLLRARRESYQLEQEQLE